MQIPYFCPDLRSARVAWEWNHLSPEERRIARTNLAATRLVFYSGYFDAVLALFSAHLLGGRRISYLPPENLSH